MFDMAAQVPNPDYLTSDSQKSKAIATASKTFQTCVLIPVIIYVARYSFVLLVDTVRHFISPTIRGYHQIAYSVTVIALSRDPSTRHLDG